MKGMLGVRGARAFPATARATSGRCRSRAILVRINFKEEGGQNEENCSDPCLAVPRLTRAWISLILAGTWADHYAEAAMYVRLNGVLPPTAKK